MLGGRSVAVPHVGVSRSTDGQTLRVGSRLRLHSASEWHLEGEFAERGRGLRLGYRYDFGRGGSVGVEGVLRENATDDSSEHGLWLRGIARW